ncbi:MAG: hypothetical protein ACJA0I_001086 [Gammaproteobacteria bacterium]|jgi:hypothetical protein
MVAHQHEAIEMNMNVHNYTTEQFADFAHCKPNSIRSRFCIKGSFYGIKPIKLPSGRLLWAAADVEAFVSGKADQS